MKKRQETLVPSISFSWNLRRAFCPVAPETAEHLIFPLLCFGGGGSQFTPSLFPTIRYVPCRMMYDLDGRQEVENEPAVLCTHAGSMTNHRSWMRRPPPASPATNDTFAEHAFQADGFIKSWSMAFIHYGFVFVCLLTDAGSLMSGLCCRAAIILSLSTIKSHATVTRGSR